MTYDKFKAAYLQASEALRNYRPGQIGAAFYAGRLADLSDAYPEYEKRLDDEQARARLEAAALNAVPAEYYYELRDSIESETDEALKAIINQPEPTQ